MMLSACAAAGFGAMSVGNRFQALAAAKHVIPLSDLGNRDVFTSCGMCVNKCGVIARVRNGVIEKLDPNPHFIKSRAM